MTKQISLVVRVLAIGVVVALVLAGTAMGAEVVIDNFEGNNLDKWVISGDSCSREAKISTSQAHSGKASLSIISNKCFIYSEYRLSKSEQGRVTIWVYDTMGTGFGLSVFSPSWDESQFVKHGNVGIEATQNPNFDNRYYVHKASAGVPSKSFDYAGNVLRSKGWHKVDFDVSNKGTIILIDNMEQPVKFEGLTQISGIRLYTGDGEVYFDDITFTSMSETASEPSSQGLVAEYHFDGDAKDSSGNGNDGTIDGAKFVQGVSGQALSFDGVNDYVNIGDPTSGVLDFGATDSFTLAAFFNANTFSGKTRSIIQKWTTPPNKGYYLRFQIEDGNLRFHILDESDGGTNPMVTYATSNFATGTWYHVAAVRDVAANKLRLYVNGIEVAYVTSTSKATSNSGDLYIGSPPSPYNGIDNFNGIIDEVRIYNRALSAEEIKANYDSTLGKSPATTATKPASAPTSSPATPAPTIAQTTRPTPAPTTAPEASNYYVYAGIGGIILLLVAIVALKRRSSSKVEEPIKHEPAVKPEPQKPAPVTESPKFKPAPMTMHEAPGVYVRTAFGYKGAAIIYKLKIENNTSDPISDIKVYPYVPDVFLLRDKEKSIALIEPKASQTVTFEIRPTGECGDCNVSGRVNYYDMASRKRQDIEIEQKSLSIVCPMLHGKEISETEWYDVVGNLVKTEESTREIGMPAESLFTMVSRVIKDMHMHMQKPEVTQNHKLFNGVARFYGEGVKGLKYAAQVEVVGGAKKSKLILKVWAEKEDALTGFYHGMLDEIEKRVNVKEYIDDSIVQYNVHVGDKIGTLVKDSVVQRSNIGASARKCPDCGREVEANEKFCLECGAKL